MAPHSKPQSKRKDAAGKREKSATGSGPTEPETFDCRIVGVKDGRVILSCSQDGAALARALAGSARNASGAADTAGEEEEEEEGDDDEGDDDEEGDDEDAEDGDDEGDDDEDGEEDDEPAPARRGSRKSK